MKLCADGLHTPHKQHLLQRSRCYAKAIQLCPLDRQGINIAYYCCYLPAITYSLPATSFHEDDLHDIQNEATSSFLSRLGFNRHFPSKVVYAPKWFGGLGLRHLHCEQGIGKLQQLLGHIRANTSLGRLFLTNIDWFQQLSGLPRPILQLTTPIPGTRNQWIASLRSFLRETQTTIKLSTEWNHPPLRLNDQHIMSLLTSADLTTLDIEKLNTVRQYLQVTTIAELIDNDGKHFHKGAFGALDNHARLIIRSFHTPLTTWPIIPRPQPHLL